MTIGQTSITLDKIIEHALRRAGISAESQTPSNVETAKNNLFFILTNFANKGMTYWCVDEQLLTLTESQSSVAMPTGTIDIYNANYRRMTASTGTDTTDTSEIVRQFDEETTTVMLQLDSTYVGDVTLATSDDGITYTDVTTISHDGTQKWYVLANEITTAYLKLYAVDPLTFDSLITVSSFSDIPMYRMNRDQYATMPNKFSKGDPLQYWFDRQVNPTMNLWPTPNEAASSNCIQVYRNHQIADVGKLDEELQIPNRWLEATIWGLAENLAFEIPGVQAERANMCIQKAASTLNDAQTEERDNSPIQWGVNIGVYTS